MFSLLTGISKPIVDIETSQVNREVFGQPKSKISKEGFQVIMNVEHFQPNEITVKTVGNHIIVQANHKERPDEYGSISQNFTRKYVLPKRYNPSDVYSTLSSDGILTIKAPSPVKTNTERIVHIQHTGPDHLPVM